MRGHTFYDQSRAPAESLTGFELDIEEAGSKDQRPETVCIDYTESEIMLDQANVLDFLQMEKE
jgi:hypothetical protein